MTFNYTYVTNAGAANNSGTVFVDQVGLTVYISQFTSQSANVDYVLNPSLTAKSKIYLNATAGNVYSCITGPAAPTVNASARVAIPCTFIGLDPGSGFSAGSPVTVVIVEAPLADEISNFDIVPPLLDGQVFAFDSGTNTFVNQTLSGGGGASVNLHYVVTQAEPSLPNSQDLSLFPTGAILAVNQAAPGTGFFPIGAINGSGDNSTSLNTSGLMITPIAVSGPPTYTLDLSTDATLGSSGLINGLGLYNNSVPLASVMNRGALTSQNNGLGGTVAVPTWTDPTSALPLARIAVEPGTTLPQQYLSPEFTLSADYKIQSLAEGVPKAPLDESFITKTSSGNLPNAQSLDTFPAGTIVQANQTPGSGFTTMGTRNPVNGLTTLGIQGLALSPNLVEPQVSFDMATDVSIGNNVPIGVALGSYSVLPLPTILNSGILSSKSVPVGATTGDVPHWKDESTNRPLLRLQQDFPTPATYTNVTFSITQDSIIRDIASGADPALATGEFVIKSPDPALPNAQALSTIALDSAVLQTDALGNLTQAFKVYPTAAPAFQPDESPFYHSGEVAFANFPRVYAEFTYSFNLTAGALVSSGEFSVSDGVLTNTLYFSKDSLSGRDMTTLWTNFPIVKGYVSILGNGATGFVALIPDTPVSQPIPNVFSFDTSTFSSTSIPDQTIISFQLFIANGLVIDTTLNNIHSQPFGSPIAGTGNTVYRATVLTQPLVGDSNAIFGNGGGSITSASKCIAIGDATTLQNCVDSISNIAIGSGSLSAQAGYSCIAIGTDCADTSTGNTTSVFIGNGCNSTGSVDSSSCVVVGIEALFNSQNNVNTNSVIIGYQAGKDSGGNDSNVIIGTAAQAAGTCNKVSRCVIVGDGATTTVDGLSGCVLLGRQTQSGFDSAICIGQGCSASAANSLNLSQLTLAGTTPQSTNISLGKCEMMLPVTIDGVQYQLPLFLP